MPNISYTAFMSGILSFFIICLDKQTVYLVAGIKTKLQMEDLFWEGVG